MCEKMRWEWATQRFIPLFDFSVFFPSVVYTFSLVREVLFCCKTITITTFSLL